MDASILKYEKRKNTRKKKMKVNKYTRLIQQKQNGKLTKKKSYIYSTYGRLFRRMGNY